MNGSALHRRIQKYRWLHSCIYGKGNIVISIEVVGGSMMEWLWSCSVMAVQR